jgi:uroporphyrinogen-III synthase
MTTQPIHLLSTRPLSGRLIEQAAEEGIVLDTLSFISTTPVADEALGRRIRDLAGSPLVAVFTSMNAVEAVKEWLQPGPEAKTSFIQPPWRIFCIGSATRQLVEKVFGAQRVAGTAESASALAENIIRQKGIQEVFFFCGDHRREELPSILQQHGITVNEWIVYRTIQTPQPTEQLYDGIAFFSPSAVESFFSVNTVAAGTRLFAIGRTTAATIGACCDNQILTSDQPEKEALVRGMIDYFSNKRKDKASDHTQE